MSELGPRRRMATGEILYEQGTETPDFFVVVSGSVEILHPTPGGEVRIHTLAPGEFTGEANLLSGRRSLVRARMVEAGEVLVITPEILRKLVQFDIELS